MVIVRLCIVMMPMYARLRRPTAPSPEGEARVPPKREICLSTHNGHHFTARQAERLHEIHARLTQARRELDALIGDAYLRPRASIVPVHFLDLASATEKLRWAEKEWRELDREMAEAAARGDDAADALLEQPDEDELVDATRGESRRS
jgi:hypothetical protein